MNLIGGVIGYEDRAQQAGKKRASVWHEDECFFFVNARSALNYLIDQLRPKTVWLPSYVCPELVMSVSMNASSIRFFPVGERLVCEKREWCDEVQQGDVVLVIHYFGISWDTGLATECKTQGAVLIRDASQALYSKLPKFSKYTGADYTVFSPRKEIGISDGGILADVNGKLSAPKLRLPPSDWLKKADEACMGRAAFDHGSQDRSWFENYLTAEAETPIGPYSMSSKSRMILEKNDYSGQANRRRENYERLLTQLADFALFPRLDERDVPLGFPVRVPLRDHVRTELFHVGIFPAIHWNLHGIVPIEFRDAHSLSRDILTLPADHRYDMNDMTRLANAFRQAALSAVKLRPLENGDLERLHRWHNDRDLYRYLVGDFFGPTLEHTSNWLQKQNQSDSGQVALAICVGQESEHVGNVYFRNIDREKKQAEIHIFIGDPNYRDRGVGTATMRTALDHAWKILNLVRVYLYVLADNTRAVRLYERVGFKRQEELEHHVLKEGLARKVLLMSTDLGSRSSTPADRQS